MVVFPLGRNGPDRRRGGAVRLERSPRADERRAIPDRRPTPGVSPTAIAPAAEVVMDNSEDTASAPPAVHFRTENPPPGALNLRSLESEPSAPRQLLRPQSPPPRLPSGPRSPFEVNGAGATVYNPPPADAD